MASETTNSDNLRSDISASNGEAAPLSGEAERRTRLYETILGNTPDLVYAFDLEHRFTYANEALLRMWGTTFEEAIGKTCLELGYEEWHAAMHDREIEEVKAAGKPIRGEVPFEGTNGRRIYDYIFSPIFGEDGFVEGIAGTARDVTDRRAAEAEAARLSERNREILESINDPYRYRSTVALVSTSTSAESLLGRSRGELTWKNLWKSSRTHRNGVRDSLRRARSSGSRKCDLVLSRPTLGVRGHVFPAKNGIRSIFGT